MCIRDRLRTDRVAEQTVVFSERVKKCAAKSAKLISQGKSKQRPDLIGVLFQSVIKSVDHIMYARPDGLGKLKIVILSLIHISIIS